MKKKIWDDSGVSEVVGTILILGMTVTLFSVVLLWIYTIPTPAPDMKVDFQGTLVPIYKSTGAWDGANITLQHNSGEILPYYSTLVYMNIYRGSTRYSDRLKLKGYMTYPPDTGKYYGLIDGSDNNWNIGERWAYTNHSILQNDRVEVLIIDTDKSVLLWQRVLQGLAGLNPPVFVEKWADRDPGTPTIDTPRTGSQFYLFAKVVDPDGDLNKKSVYVAVTAFYGSKDFKETPQKMRDDGGGGDQVANDTIFTFTASWLVPANMSWDGSVVIFNATDLAGHKTTSRMTLSVILGSTSTTKPKPWTPGSGAPPNLNYNGLQGFNIFNGTEWDEEGFNASETRTFKEGEEVVLVVGSMILTDLFGRDTFILYDPFSNVPLSPVVYGTNKEVTGASIPSTTQAFTFFLYVSGYNVWVYRFELNNVTISPTECKYNGGTCYLKNPSRPPQYYFGSYPLEIDLIDFLGNRFTTSDTITITANDGTVRNYPTIQTFRDSNYNYQTNQFNSTDMIYTQVVMKTVDGSITNVVLGNVVIQDFLGGLQVFRAPINGHDANPPICPVTGACTGTAVSINAAKIAYRFAINLSLANQDPWVEGRQHYALRLLSIDDSDEHYSLVLSSQLVITAPLFRMDAVEGFTDSQNPAWGSHDIMLYLVDWNGVDKWTSGRLEQPYPKQQVDHAQVMRYLDFNGDGKLDVAAEVVGDSGGLNLYRQDSDQGGSIQWTKTTLEVPSSTVKDMRSGSLNKDTAPELVAAAANQVWYYLNDGTWTIPGQSATKVFIDSGAVRTSNVNALDLGDFNNDSYLDVAVGRAGGKVTYYMNDGTGKFTTTLQDDKWYAEFEQTTTGTRGGNYSRTINQDGTFENLKEAVVDLSAASGGTVNAAFDNPNQDGVSANNWTFAGWSGYNPSSTSGHKHTSGGNPDHDFSVHMACVKGGQVGGYIQQPFTVTVQGATATFNLDYRFFTKGSTASNMQFYAFVETSSGDPTVGTNQVWTSGQLSSTTNWGNSPMVNVDVSSRVTQPGTYYLKIGIITQYSNANCGTESVGLLDNAKIYWSRAAGQSSQLTHYYRMQQLPSRAGSTYTFRVYGHRTDNSSEGDNFVFAYSTTGQYGTYTNMVTVNSATDTAYTYTMPGSVGGAVVWVRVQDADLTVGRTTLDLVYVDQMYIDVYTPGGVNGYDITLPGDTSDVVALDARDTNPDGYDDVYVGTTNGNVFRLAGGSGGLTTPTGVLISGGVGGAVVNLKVGNVTGVGMREVAVAVGTVVKVYNALTGVLLSTAQHTGAQTITAMAMGDIDGNGHDDLFVGGSGGELTYYRWLPGGWVPIIIRNEINGTPIDTKVWDVDVGDMSKAQYMSR